jgi:hypothetical protein
MYYILNASLLLVVAWVQLISAAAAFDENFPPSDAEWITLSETESFQPAPTNDNPRLRHAQRDLVQYSSKLADGLKYYDEYSQAWRMLGMFIDCNAEKDDHRRQLDEANVESGGSCQRYLLWAAVSACVCARVSSSPTEATGLACLRQRQQVWLDSHSLLLYYSTLIWIIKVEELASISSTTLTKTRGIHPRASRLRVADVPRWTAICLIPTLRFSASLNNKMQAISWNNYSSIKRTVCGMGISTSS